MAEKSYSIREACACGNEAYRTTADGRRTCGLCSLNVVSVRDSDLPAFIAGVAALLRELQSRSLPSSLGAKVEDLKRVVALAPLELIE